MTKTNIKNAQNKILKVTSLSNVHLEICNNMVINPCLQFLFLKKLSRHAVFKNMLCKY